MNLKLPKSASLASQLVQDPVSGITGGLLCPPGIYMNGDPNSALHSSKVSTLYGKPSLQPLRRHLLNYLGSSP